MTYAEINEGRHRDRMTNNHNPNIIDMNKIWWLVIVRYFLANLFRMVSVRIMFGFESESAANLLLNIRILLMKNRLRFIILSIVSQHVFLDMKTINREIF